MQFSGILVRIGSPSDAPPGGSGGKRIILTAAAAHQALPGLLGMGVNLTSSLAGHDPAVKVGVITDAGIEGDAVTIKGFLYCCDFPVEALRAHTDQARLGFSFEAQRVAVEDPAADPLTIIGLAFTGAAILARDAAAYRTTALAIMAGKSNEHLAITEDLKMAAGASKFVDARLAAAGDLGVHRSLLRVMAAAGVHSPEDRGSLSEQQLNRLLENKTVSERIEIRNSVMASGYYPRTLPSFTSMPKMR